MWYHPCYQRRYEKHPGKSIFVSQELLTCCTTCHFIPMNQTSTRNLQQRGDKWYCDWYMRSSGELGWRTPHFVDNTYQPLDRSYDELHRNMAKVRMEIKSVKKLLEKEVTAEISIDSIPAPSIDIRKTTSRNPTQPECSSPKKVEWEIAYINTKIGDVYSPLNNNIDWLNKRIDLLQQKLKTIREQDQCQNHHASSIDTTLSTSIDNKLAAMEDRLKSYEEKNDHFTSPFMRYFDTLSKQMIEIQQDVDILQDQLGFYHRGSTSIDRIQST